MTRRSTIAAALLAVAVFSLLSLALGAPFLEARLPGGIPVGNVLTGLGLCALAGTAVVLSVRGSALRVASTVSLVGAALWLPVSVALAGNPELNFGGGRGAIWLAWSLFVVAGAGGTLLWALLSATLARRRGVDAAWRPRTAPDLRIRANSRRGLRGE